MPSRRLLLAVGILGLALPCCRASEQTVPMPVHLVGRWTTESASHADRFFEITETAVVIGTGAGTRERYVVAAVSRAGHEDGVLYTIRYLDAAGTRSSMAFIFDDSTGETVRLANQRHMVWRKAP